MTSVVSFELESNRDSPFYPSLARTAAHAAALAETHTDCAGLTVLRGWLAPASRCAALFESMCAEFQFTCDDSTPNQAMFHHRDAMPASLQLLADALASSAAILNALDDSIGFDNDILSRFPLFDQGIVNHYRAHSSGICEHIDLSEFDDGIVGLSLGGSCVFIMRLRDADGLELARHDIELHAGDLLMMRGDARYRWTHAIESTPERRISITLRKRLVPPTLKE